jgi:hypothetical protein
VDANGWRCLLARAKAPEKVVWALASPPAASGGIRADAYSLAIADAAAYGARWVIELDPDLRAGLARNQGGALEVWREVHKTVRFFERHKEWGRQPEIARLGIASSFTGPAASLAQEVLNLAQRRPLPYRVIDSTRLHAASVAGLKALLWIQESPPEGADRKTLAAFVNEGGLLIGPPALAELAAGKKGSSSAGGRYTLYQAGPGRIAIASKPWTDPYVLTLDTHLLMGRREDVIRGWNSGSANVHLTSSPDGGALLQIVNYTTRPAGHPMSFYVAGRFRSAKWVTIAEDSPRDLPVTPRGDGVEVYVPPFPVYGAIEFRDRA